MTIDFGHRHVRTERPGGPDLLRGAGEAVIDDGGSRYFYTVARGEIREFRSWAQYAFQPGLSAVRVAGNYRDGYVIEVC